MIRELHKILKVLDNLLGRYPVFVFLVDSQEHMVWCNRYTESEWPELAALIQTENSPESFFTIERTIIADTDDLKSRLVKKFQVRRENQKSGQPRIIEFLSIPVVQGTDSGFGNICIGIDITEGEKGRRLLREKQKLLATIIESSTDAVIVTDTDNQVISWNSGAQALFGYRAEEMLRRPIDVLIPPAQLDDGELDKFYQDLDEKGTLHNHETLRLRKDGTSCFVDISSVKLYDEKDRPQGISQIIKSIDSRKKLESELLRTILELSKLNELNEILYSTHDENEILAIILVAITAGEGLRFNRAFLLMNNPEQNELQGALAIGPADEEDANRIWQELDSESRTLNEIVSVYRIDRQGSDRKVNDIVQQIRVPLTDDEQILARAMNERRFFHVEEKAIVGGGHCSFEVGETNLFDILQHDTFVVAPMYTKKEPLGILIADNGINNRRIGSEDVESVKLFAHQASLAIENARLHHSLEARIEQLQVANLQIAEKQEQLLQAERLAAIGEMSAKIAHEIRNPLVSIGGFARVIEKKTEDGSVLKQYAGIISEQVMHLESILNNILAVARQPDPLKVPVDVNELLRQVLRMMEPALSSRNIQFVLDESPEDTFVRGDEKQLYQAFINLVKNAIEALENRMPDAEIRICNRLVAGQIEITVSDNGPGIEQNLISKIFQSFFTTKSGGTGLGLAIVRQIVENHQGTINVTSRAGNGSTFLISLPAANPSDDITDSNIQ